VFTCDRCAHLGFGFSRSSATGPLYKFPPLIGSQGPAALLFIGLNPRRSAGNAWLHDQIMADEVQFAALAGNRVDGRAYVAVDGPERHYRPHAQIAAAAFPGRSFEEVATVTELFHCATEDGSDLPRAGSPCGDRYLGRVIELVQPRVIVAVGKAAENYLRPRFGARQGSFRVAVGSAKALVVPIPHPAAWGEKAARYDEAMLEVVAALGGPAARLAGAAAPEVEAGPVTGVAGASLASAKPPSRWPWLFLTIAGIGTAVTALCCCGGGS
jgi:uracil-DNA glycosylase